MRRFVVSGLSMSPALSPGDRFLTRRLRRPHRGQVVLFPHPDKTDFWLIKRVVGLPEETVAIAGGLVLVNGVELAEPWAVGATGPDGAWDIEPGRVFVLSDARHRTLADSRIFGPVPIQSAHLAFLRYWRGDERETETR